MVFATVLFGSVGFMAYGLQTASGDLDICIDPDEQNLRRLSTLLLEVGAKPRYVPGWSEKEACERWQPEPLVVETFDHLFTTTYGDLDIVPFPYGPHGREDRFTFTSLDVRADNHCSIRSADPRGTPRCSHRFKTLGSARKRSPTPRLRSSDYRNFRRKAKRAAGL